MKYFILNGGEYKATVSLNGNHLSLGNGLVERIIDVEKCETISYKNLITGIELVNAAFVDTMIKLSGERDVTDFTFVSAREAERRKLMDFKPSPTMTEVREYPPAGKAYEIIYESKAEGLKMVVHYEIYDGIPTVMKFVRVENKNKAAIQIDNIKADILCIEKNREHFFVDSNFNATNNISTLDMNVYGVHFCRYIYDKFEVSPKYKMNVKLESGEKLDSIIAYETIFVAKYYEQRLIELKMIYRHIAPWCMDSALFFHLIANSTKAIKFAVDQCREVGVEMIIQSFGSGVNMESSSKRYLKRIKAGYDYGHEKGLRMGAYTLAYVKNYRSINSNEAINHDYSHICRCLATDWAEKYTKSVLNFIDKTGCDAIEIDGPYGMQFCSGGKTHTHADFADSQYKQWKLSVYDWYKELKARNVYINAPDWHFLNGINRCPVGYEEISFSEKRAEQLVVSRIYYYKGTFLKNPSQGWGFLPLNVYHGGGADAQFFPTDKNAFEFDWAMAQIVASGIWPTLRGRRIFDCDSGKDILKKWITVYKKYRQVLNGMSVHFLPPIIDKKNPERTMDIDALMTQQSYGENRGFVMFYNQTDKAITKKILIPVFYTGLTNLENPPPPFPNTKNCDIEFPVYGEEISPLVILAAEGENRRKYKKDAEVTDAEIPTLKVATATDRKINICKEGANPCEYVIDSNGNVEFEVSLKPMSYSWYILKA